MNAFAHASAPAGPELDGRRILAAVIDLALVILGGVVLVTLFGTLTGAEDPLSSTPVRVVLVAWALYYFFALESGDGQTVGKKVMKLRVVRTDGNALTMREVAIRTALRVVDVFAGLVVMIVTRERRQRLGDIAAGTVVADASAAPAEAATNAAAAAPTEQIVDADEPLPFEDSEPPTFAPPEAPGSHELEPAQEPAQAPAPQADTAAPAADAPAPDRESDFDPFALTQPATQAQPDAAELQEEPVAEPTAYEMPAQEEPVQEEPAAPAAPAAYDAPELEAPASDAPAYDAPTYDAPAYDEPAAEPPVQQAPSLSDLVDEQRAAESAPDSAPSEPVFPEAQAQQPAAADAEKSGPTPEESLAQLMGEQAPASDEAHEDEDGDVSVRSVQTMSAIDMVMGGDDEHGDESPEGDDGRPSQGE